MQELFKKVLGVPGLMMLYLIIPVGYPAVEPSEGVRRPLDEIVHHDHYEESKFMSNERVIQFSRAARQNFADLPAVVCRQRPAQERLGAR